MCVRLYIVSFDKHAELHGSYQILRSFSGALREHESRLMIMTNYGAGTRRVEKAGSMGRLYMFTLRGRHLHFCCTNHIFHSEYFPEGEHLGLAHEIRTRTQIPLLGASRFGTRSLSRNHLKFRPPPRNHPCR